MTYPISGLDPAGPGFDGGLNGLNKTCAQFVQVLHTNPGELGTNEQRGDLNFYANNRTTLQPGCPFKQCGHAKAIFYYFASLFPQYEFIGVDCNQQDSRQSDAIFSRFGFLNDGNEGNFCFNTTSCFPFTPEITFTSTEMLTESSDTSSTSESSSTNEISSTVSETSSSATATSVEFENSTQTNSTDIGRTDEKTNGWFTVPKKIWHILF